MLVWKLLQINLQISYYCGLVKIQFYFSILDIFPFSQKEMFQIRYVSLPFGSKKHQIWIFSFIILSIGFLVLSFPFPFCNQVHQKRSIYQHLNQKTFLLFNQ
ncbi:unnamed protein product [Paramecium sonneborni]|uniref:Transmembrane protein n=1 Tax=Paramecium sonneborni TaxID=65129 RepID=A0A8S1QTZ6_9CILI|nr:unnamed protein product [Paramecium sonneborni]